MSKNNLSKFVNHVTIKYRMRNTLSQKIFQITFVRANEREGFAKFVIPVSLFTDFIL